MKCSKLFLFAMLSFVGIATAQESIICSYTGYLNSEKDGGHVIVEFEIRGSKATEGKFKEEYQVLQNNKYGVVLARTFAEYSDYLKRPTVGGYLFSIERATGAMARNNSFPNDSDAYRKGTCIFR